MIATILQFIAGLLTWAIAICGVFYICLLASLPYSK